MIKVSRNEPTDDWALLSKQGKILYVFQETLEIKGNI